jgi:hypothetical protein
MKLLHIGGVMDGKWIEVKGEYAAYPGKDLEPHHYRRETLAAQDATFNVMIYTVATTEMALGMLIQGYRAPAAR